MQWRGRRMGRGSLPGGAIKRCRCGVSTEPLFHLLCIFRWLPDLHRSVPGCRTILWHPLYGVTKSVGRELSYAIFSPSYTMSFLRLPRLESTRGSVVSGTLL